MSSATAESVNSSSSDSNSVDSTESLRQRNSANNSNASTTSNDSATAAPSKPLYNGFTHLGERFIVPETLNTVQTLLPQNWSITSIIVILLLLFNIISTLFFNWSKWPHIIIFLIFRFSYNIGLGIILRNQSKSRLFEYYYIKLFKQYGGIHSNHWIIRLLNHLAQSQLLNQSIDIKLLPNSFNSWLIYKNIVNIILINDGITYLLLCYKCYNSPPNYSLLVIGQYILGFALWIFNYWAKLDAHRAIGENAWFWGDFFFRKDEKLTFDGIFELFPHPMYTVGYSGYYGCTLLSRSYTMLFVSLIAHAMQMGFLFFVEEPHIERTYGKPELIDNESKKILYDPETGLFPNKQDPIFIFHLHWYRAADIGLIILLLYTILFSFSISNHYHYYLIIQVIIWRIIHWFGLGTLLWLQSRLQFWTRLYSNHHRSLFEAFSNWKLLYNFSITMNWAVFIIAACREIEFEFIYLTRPSYVASIILGIILIILSLWSSYSTYQCVGEFGWFYGDFFITDNTFRQDLCYTGIYRFLNNPDCWAGYIGQYGFALISQSWSIAGLAMLSQGLNFMFLNLVELPHMQKLYENVKIRNKTPIEGAIQRLTAEFGTDISHLVPEPIREKAAAKADQLEYEIKKEINKIRINALSEMYEMYEKLKLNKEKRKLLKLNKENQNKENKENHNKENNNNNQMKRSKSAGSNSINDNTNNTNNNTSTTNHPMITLIHSKEHIIGRPLEVSLSSDPMNSSDWIGIYPLHQPSKPGASDGKWLYVTEGNNNNKLIFPPSRLPNHEGIYEIRYHSNNEYKVHSSGLIIFLREENSPNINNNSGSETDSDVEENFNISNNNNKNKKKN